MKNIFINNLTKKHKWISIIYLILRLSVIFIMLDEIRDKSYENVFLCILTLILFTVPSFIERKIHIDIPDTIETIILLFIFSAEILGEIREYYIIFPYWDTLLHTLNGFLSAAIGFSLIDILNKHERFSISMSPVFVALVAFCFSMTIGVVWEFFEYGMDQLVGSDMQKDTIISSFRSVLLNADGKNVPVTVNIENLTVNGDTWNGYIDIGLIDTMMDLVVNFIGAFVFSIIGFLYIKQRGKSTFLKRFILKFYTDKSL
ncbi:MAG: hypothetical protein K0S76_2295 [Herbinix sp.]|nr:hypothetical protein [Herbinix sp.]